MLEQIVMKIITVLHKKKLFTLTYAKTWLNFKSALAPILKDNYSLAKTSFFSFFSGMSLEFKSNLGGVEGFIQTHQNSK